LALLKNVHGGKVFQKDKPVKWSGYNCGFGHEGTAALEKCPACQHPQGHLEITAENY
jgi:rubrerythrin